MRVPSGANLMIRAVAPDASPFCIASSVSMP
jgi:hypothetical protein